jgi:beta-lactamase superfamily II metal-dependent hydrolase
VTVREARPGRTIDLGGGARLTLLGPPDPPIRGTRSDVNANSVVARLDYRALSVLFLGDAEAETERWLLARDRAALRARVVKVAHHGSRHSSSLELVAATGAEAAVFSCGSPNDYGHPHPEALARWRAAGARLFRTDEQGEVRLVSDGATLEWTTARPAAPQGAPARDGGP